MALVASAPVLRTEQALAEDDYIDDADALRTAPDRCRGGWHGQGSVHPGQVPMKTREATGSSRPGIAGQGLGLLGLDLATGR